MTTPTAPPQVTDTQRAKYGDRLKQISTPGWMENIDNRKITMVFFAAYRDDFAKVLNGDPWGKGVTVVRADDQLKARNADMVPAGFANHLPEGDTFSAHGCSGVKWVIETSKPETYAKGQVATSKACGSILRRHWIFSAKASATNTAEPNWV